MGGALQKSFARHETISYDREDLDVTDFVKLRGELARLSPDVVINCVAWNDVDGAEAEAEGAKFGQIDRAMLLNCDVVREVAKICASQDITLVTYSTDNVFSGEKSGGYVEEDNPCPINAYGRSKACGEIALKEEMNNFYLIRTSRLYGEKPTSGNAKISFVSRMIELGEKNKELSVVNEEPGAFTYAADLSEATKKLIEDKFPFDIYHLISDGAVTWFECAREIFACLGMEVSLRPVQRKDYLRSAPVPKHSILINTKFPHLRNWKTALQDFLGEKISCRGSAGSSI